ncbi:MAG: ribosome silencing factor [bacterium]
MYTDTTRSSYLATSGNERVLACIDACLSKKAEDVVALDISGLTTIADYFIICSGASQVQMRAIAEANEEVLDKQKPRCRREGTDKWILIDGGDIIIHVFHEDTRRFYELENLWADGKRVLNLESRIANCESEEMGRNLES